MRLGSYTHTVGAEAERVDWSSPRASATEPTAAALAAAADTAGEGSTDALVLNSPPAETTEPDPVTCTRNSAARTGTPPSSCW